mmetsp:Transcript_25258/g.66204  ORF Transcript_25258/g.66204 Transcript_25258/m.66204 type:complete len:327 (-) Transcript_25258:128-1108(-)
MAPLTSHIAALPEPLHSTYVLQEMIGSGAYALVYRAQHRASEESFAVKVVQKDQLEARQMMPQLRREIEFLQALSGTPQVVQLLDIVDTRQRIFLRFELCAVNLEELVQSTGPVRTDYAQRWSREVAQGLAVMHRLGQVHRDIKPSNMLLDAEGSVKICDLGWACLESERQVGSCGSAVYAPPEQLTSMGQPHTSRSDIYSLGVSLQHFLLGRVPLGSHDCPHDRDAEVLNVLRHMMQPNPTSRPSAEDLLMHPVFATNLIERLWKRGTALVLGTLEKSPSETSTRPSETSTGAVSPSVCAVHHTRVQMQPVVAHIHRRVWPVAVR